MAIEKTVTIMGRIHISLARPLSKTVLALGLASSSLVPSHQVLVQDPTAGFIDPSIKLPDAIKNIKRLTQEIAEGYPNQNLGHLRPIFDNLSIYAEKYSVPWLKQLYDNKREILRLLDNAKRIANHDPAARQELNKEEIEDLRAILSARTLFDLLDHFAPQASRAVTVNPPGNLPPFEIQLTPDRSAWTMYKLITSSPRLQASTHSSSGTHEELNTGSAKIEAWFAGKFCDSSPASYDKTYAQFYIDVHGVNRSLPLPELDRLIAELEEKFKGQVANPARIWISDLEPSKEGNTWTLNSNFAFRYVDLKLHADAFRLIKTYQFAYNEAARKLHDSHPDISSELFRGFLLAHSLITHTWLRWDDVWQDAGAASALGTAAQAFNFGKTYSAYKKQGYAFGITFKEGDTMYDCPWGLASLMKLPIPFQSLGHNTVMSGDLLISGERDGGRLWHKYFPEIEMTEENAVRIALDPVNSLYAVALVCDAKLDDLNKTVFSNPQVGLPSDVYPYIKNPKDARRYLMIELMGHLRAFPEVGKNFPNAFPFNIDSWNLGLGASYNLLISRILGENSALPYLKGSFVVDSGEKLDAFHHGKPEKFPAIMWTLTPND